MKDKKKRKKINLRLSSALGYLEEGLSVIPLVPQGKKPCLAKWKKYQRRLPTEKKVRLWWKKWPKANIGIVTGKLSNLVVLDLDSNRARAFVKEHGKPDTCEVQTGRGTHLYFKRPKNRDIPSQINKELGLDVRSDGGYVVAPPSLHPDGTRYKWITKFSRKKLAPLPEWTFNLGESKEPKKVKPPQAQAFPEILTGVDRGERDDALFRYACQLRGQGKVSLAEARVLVLHAANNCRPPFPEAEALKKLAQAWKYSPEETSPDAADPLEFGTIYTIDDLLDIDEGAEASQDIIPGLLPEQGILMIIGEAGVGKTLIVQEFSIRMALGLEILGLPITKPRKVVIFHGENLMGKIKERVIEMAKGFNIDPLDLKKSILFYRYHGKFDLNEERYLSIMKKIIKDFGAKVFVLDPFVNFHKGSENDNDLMAQILGNVSRICRETDNGVIIIHHPNKPTFGVTKTDNRFRGAGAIKAAVDTMIFMEKGHRPDEFQIEFNKIRYAAPRDPIMLKRNQYFLHTIIGHTSKVSAEQVKEILVSKFGGKVSKQGDLIKAIEGECRCSNKTAFEAVKKAIAQRKIKEKKGEGRALGYHI